MTASAGERLRLLLTRPQITLMPSCWDALSARLVEQAGYEVSLMSGFAVSGSRLAMPDTGLISFAEMADQLNRICAAAPRLLVIGDGDTGYGNALNVQRTVREYARAGAAAVMIEDQVSPKRCGHTQGKQVIGAGEARMKIRAAVDAARESGVLLMARTDARAVNGFDDAMERCRFFAQEGADILFLEAPESEAEMRAFCGAFRQPTMANMVSGGKTPVLPPATLQEIGYRLACYPLTAFSAAVAATLQALRAIRQGVPESVPQVDFATLKALVGFDDYDARAQRYRDAE